MAYFELSGETIEFGYKFGYEVRRASKLDTFPSACFEVEPFSAVPEIVLIRRKERAGSRPLWSFQPLLPSFVSI